MTNPDLAAVKRRINDIENQIVALEDELEDLIVAQRALERLGGNVHPKALPLSPKDTVENLVLAALERSTKVWLTVTEVQDLIKNLSTREIPMGTLSPQVSFMKKQNKVVRDGQLVALPARAEEEKIPF